MIRLQALSQCQCLFRLGGMSLGGMPLERHVALLLDNLRVGVYRVMNKAVLLQVVRKGAWRISGSCLVRRQMC